MCTDVDYDIVRYKNTKLYQVSVEFLWHFNIELGSIYIENNPYAFPSGEKCVTVILRQIEDANHYRFIDNHFTEIPVDPYEIEKEKELYELEQKYKDK